MSWSTYGKQNRAVSTPVMKEHSTVNQVVTSVKRAIDAWAKTDEAKERGIFEDGAGACAIASAALVDALSKSMILADFIEGYYDDGEMKEDETGEPSDIPTNHCWVEYDGHIIDLTAKQFGAEQPEIKIVPKDSDEGQRYEAEHNWEADYDRMMWQDATDPDRETVGRIVESAL